MHSPCAMYLLTLLEYVSYSVFFIFVKPLTILLWLKNCLVVQIFPEVLKVGNNWCSNIPMTRSGRWGEWMEDYLDHSAMNTGNQTTIASCLVSLHSGPKELTALTMELGSLDTSNSSVALNPLTGPFPGQGECCTGGSLPGSLFLSLPFPRLRESPPFWPFLCIG